MYSVYVWPKNRGQRKFAGHIYTHRQRRGAYTPQTSDGQGWRVIYKQNTPSKHDSYNIYANRMPFLAKWCICDICNLCQHRVMAAISVYVHIYAYIHTAVTCDANYVFVPDSFGAAALSVWDRIGCCLSAYNSIHCCVSGICHLYYNIMCVCVCRSASDCSTALICQVSWVPSTRWGTWSRGAIGEQHWPFKTCPPHPATRSTPWSHSTSS